MRRFGIGFAILSLLLAIGIGVGAYSIGYHHGLDVNGSVEVVRYAGWHAGGFFPFAYMDMSAGAAAAVSPNVELHRTVDPDGTVHIDYRVRIPRS